MGNKNVAIRKKSHWIWEKEGCKPYSNQSCIGYWGQWGFIFNKKEAFFLGCGGIWDMTSQSLASYFQIKPNESLVRVIQQSKLTILDS